MKRLLTTLISLCVVCFFSHSVSWEGTGTAEDPFLISTPHQLAELASEVNNGTSFYEEYFNLTDDIDLSEICGSTLGNWESIGNQEQNFEGTFSGNNHTILNLYIGQSYDNNVFRGLFGFIGKNGVVRNLTIKNGSIYSSYWGGGIAGANNGVITNCSNINCVIGSWQFSGGICGVNFNKIEGCTNQATVTSTLCSGGICSYNYSVITDCVNRSDITSNEGCGGICGYNGGFGDITNCDNTKIGFIDKCKNYSSIVGETKTGGIAGRNDGVIVNTMNSGEVNGNQEIGGIAGYNGGFDGVTGNISNSYNIGNIIGLNQYVGGIVGYGNKASEIYNVYTGDNILCVNSSDIQSIGEEHGKTDNCLIFPLASSTTYLNSIANQFNQWIDDQSDSYSYSKWRVVDINQNPTLCMIEKEQQASQFNVNNDDDFRVFCGKNKFYIFSQNRQTIRIYSINGKMIRSTELLANVLTMIPIEKGVYIVNNRKIVVY